MEKQRKSKHEQEEFTDPVEAYDEQPKLIMNSQKQNQRNERKGEELVSL